MPRVTTGGTSQQPINAEEPTMNKESVSNDMSQKHHEQMSQEPEKREGNVANRENPAQNAYNVYERTATPTIVNTKVPIVVFVGPPTSGKSMILVRLAKFLRNEGYTIETDPTFLNTQKYQDDCTEFNHKLNTCIALDGSVKFLLVTIKDKTGKEIAKLLEAPGEDFYTTDPEKIKAGKNMRVEPYLATIMTSNNPKSYVMLLDLDSEVSFRNDSYHRDSYAQRFLNYFLPAINLNRDRIVLLYNKIDKTAFGTINGCSNPREARKDSEIYYKQIFARIKGGLFNLEQFAFKTFCTGMFSGQLDEAGNRYQIYNVASDTYPRDLWREIVKKW